MLHIEAWKGMQMGRGRRKEEAEAKEGHGNRNVDCRYGREREGRE